MDYKNLHDDYLEATILGEMLSDPSVAKTGVEMLSPEDFYVENFNHVQLFKAMYEINKRDEVIDSNSIVTQLKLNKTYEKIGGLEFLNELLDQCVSTINLENHIGQLKDITLLRKLAEKCNEILINVNNKPVDSITNFLTKAENDVNDITSKRRVSNFERADTLARRVGKSLQDATGEEAITGLKTGYDKLDVAINGLGKGQVILIAARPGVGKSQLALNICFNVARNEVVNNKKPTIAYFSLEMSNAELMKRLFAIASRTSQYKINTGHLNKTDKLSLKEAQELIENTDMYFEESTSLTIDEICLKSKKLKEQKNDLALIVIDHIGIIQEGNHKFSSDQEKIAYYSRRIKVLALELDCPILLVCHINRKADETDFRKPELSQLRGSGSLENDADKALLLYRTNYYKKQGISLKQKKPGDESQEQEAAPEIDVNRDAEGEKATIIIAKNRQGPTGEVNLLFFPSFGTFDNPDGDFGDE